MSEPGDFLSRWSRRKRAAALPRVEDDTPKRQMDDKVAAPERVTTEASIHQKAEPEFDITQLPSLDSIGPTTDISVFMQPGVPSSLRQAALRRVWVSDPAIRDFRAPQETDWDFNTDKVFGFGEIGPEVDVKQMVARIFGEGEPEPAAPEDHENYDSSIETSSHNANKADADTKSESVNVDDVNKRESVAMLQSNDDAASQQDDLSSSNLPPRRHGSALPH